MPEAKHWVVRYEYADRAPFIDKWFEAFLGDPTADGFKRLVEDQCGLPLTVTLAEPDGTVLYTYTAEARPAEQREMFVVQEELL